MHAVESLLQLLSVNIVLKGQLLQVLLADKGGLDHLVLLHTIEPLLSPRPHRTRLRQVLSNCMIELLLSDLRIPLQQPHREFVNPLLLIVPQLLLLLLLPQVHRSAHLNSGPKLLADSVNVTNYISVILDFQAQFLDQGNRPLLVLLLSQRSSLLLLPERLESGCQLLSLEFFEAHGLLVVKHLLRLLLLLQKMELLEFRVLLLLC